MLPACKDCAHIKPFYPDKKLSKCAVSFSICPVTGKKEYSFCSVSRMDYVYTKKCGSEGRWFEPKQSIFQRYAKILRQL